MNGINDLHKSTLSSFDQRQATQMLRPGVKWVHRFMIALPVVPRVYLNTFQFLSYAKLKQEENVQHMIRLRDSVASPKE